MSREDVYRGDSDICPGPQTGIYNVAGELLAVLNLPDDSQLSRRIAAAVHATADWKVETLEQIAASLIPLRFEEVDLPHGNLESQARAWRQVWQHLYNTGLMEEPVPPGPSCGMTRVLNYIKRLQRRVAELEKEATS